MTYQRRSSISTYRDISLSIVYHHLRLLLLIQSHVLNNPPFTPRVLPPMCRLAYLQSDAVTNGSRSGPRVAFLVITRLVAIAGACDLTVTDAESHI